MVAVSSTPAHPAAGDPPAAKPVDLDLSASALDALVSLAAFLPALFLRPPSACTAEEADELELDVSAPVSSSVLPVSSSVLPVSSSVLLCPAVPTYVIHV